MRPGCKGKKRHLSWSWSVVAFFCEPRHFRKNIRALIIDSAFASYRLIAREKMNNFWLTWPFQYPLSYLVNKAYSPREWI